MTAPWYVEQLWRGHISWLTPAWTGPRTEWDAKKWVDHFERAGFRSFIFYSKFHDGFCVWPSRFREMPPERDFLGEIVAEAHARDMRVVLYYSTTPDRQTAEEHPDWRCVPAPQDEDGNRNAVLFPSCCINNPGYRDFLLGQMQEIQATYHTDGWWLDIFWSGGFDARNGCLCSHCLRKFSHRSGGQSLTHLVGTVEFRLWERDCFREVLGEIRRILDQDRPDGALTYNAAGVMGGFHPSRVSGLLDRPGYRALESEVDCLSWEGHTPNPLELDYYCRYLRSSGRPYEITSFASDGTISWTMKSTDLLMLESMTIVAHGGICSVGVDPTPSGHIFDQQIDQLATVNAYVRDIELYLTGTAPLYDVGMFAGGPAIRDGSWYDPRATGGWATALTERHVPFTWLYPESEFVDIPLIVLDGDYPLDMALAERIAAHVEGGGSLIVEFDGLPRAPSPTAVLLQHVLGIARTGQSEFEAHYIGDLAPGLALNLSAMPTLVQGGAYKIELTTAEPLARFVYPIAPRSAARAIFSFQNPPSLAPSGDVAISANRYGKGRAYYVACPLGTRAIRHHRNNQVRTDPPFIASWQNAWPTQLAANLARYALGSPLTESRLPPGVGVILNRQAGRVLLHLLNNYLRPEQFYDARSGLLRLQDLPIALSSDRLGPVRRAFLPSDGRTLTLDASDGWIRFNVPDLKVHQLVVLEQ